MAVDAVWVFDVDGCLIDSLTGRSLRPGAVQLLTHLRTAGATLRLWSAGGASYAEARAREQGIAGYFDGFHGKEGRDGDGRYRTGHFLAGHDGVVFVDDRPEDLPIGSDVVAVPPYLSGNPHDRGLFPAAERAGLRAGSV